MSDLPTNRNILIIEGDEAECIIAAQKLSKNLHTLFLDSPKKANEYLGQEFDAVIFNAFEIFDANAFAAISGTIRGAGYFIILKPVIWSDSLFLTRLTHFLQQQENVEFIDPKQQCLRALTPLGKKEYSELYATEDQKLAVDAVIRVVKGHRRRPLVISADRGRGKSSALGIAAAELSIQGVSNIIVCAPNKKTASAIFQHAININPEIHLKFYSPDELQRQQPDADLVLVDEAAAIPVALLISFAKRYSRIVFASTQHGYEGSGRGFTIRFQKALEELAPEWKSIYLKEPIRWQENDSLEQFVFKIFLLNVELIDSEKLNNIQLSDCKFITLDKDQLVKNEALLSEVFSLLVNAHYQTKPSDLKQILDDTSLSIFSLQANNCIAAIVLVLTEGNIDESLSKEIFAGKRRINGHLVAQALAANVGVANAPMLQGERISRIAVHPILQQQGFGTLLLKSLNKISKADYLSSSFGATDLLISFWKQAGFTAVHIGTKRDASSGAHSVIMLKEKSKQGKMLLQEASVIFNKSFPHLLSDSLGTLESKVALSLLSTQSEVISKGEFKIIKAFSEQQRSYENSLYPIWKLVCNKLTDDQILDDKEKKLVVNKVLQKRGWIELSQKMSGSISGKKEALSLLRRSVAKLLSEF
ncbi:MAG: GNAT family N-acetyltransferase [Cocleimonas sp.]